MNRVNSLLLGIFLVIMATLACASEIPSTDFLPATRTPKNPSPTPALDSLDPNYVLTLPKEVKSSGGATFTVKRVELLKSIDTPTQSYTPQNGIYLWLIGTVGNFSDKRLCLRGQDFAVVNGSERYEMRVEEAEALYKLSNLPYPDFYLGHCLDKGQTIDSFLIMDVSREAGDLWLELGSGRARLGRTAALIAATPVPAVAWPDPTVPSASDQATAPLVTAAKTDVNIRSGPGTNYGVIGLLRTGQSLEIVGRTADSAWWQVSTPQGLGWVSAKVTIASNVDERVPVR